MVFYRCSFLLFLLGYVVFFLNNIHTCFELNLRHVGLLEVSVEEAELEISEDEGKRGAFSNGTIDSKLRIIHEEATVNGTTRTPNASSEGKIIPACTALDLSSTFSFNP